MNGRLGIIIGFEYLTDKLPGTIIDIYRIYKIMEKYGIDDIILITDIKNDKKCTILHKSIIENVVDVDILNFIESMKEMNKYNYCTNVSDMEKIFSKINVYNKIIIYYSGHAKFGEIIMSNGTCYNKDDFRKIILSKSNDKSELLILFDCCQCPNFDLPYYYQYKKDRDNKTKYRLVFDDNIKFTKQKIIFLASSTKDQDSAATKNGSYFTLALTKILDNQCYDIHKICEYISDNSNKEYPQTITVYTSFPNLKNIWSWIFTPYSISFNQKNLYINFNFLKKT